MLLTSRSAAILPLGLWLTPVSADAAATINGGGIGPQSIYSTKDPASSALAGEMALFNAGGGAAKGAAFGTYWAGRSATGQTGLLAGQTAFLTDNLSCDSNLVTGANGGNCSGSPGGADTVHYAMVDQKLTAAQIESWAISLVGQTAAGNLIQLPMFGSATAIVVNDSGITANGQLQLSDKDLCGVFSGKITKFNQIKDSGVTPAAGKFTLVYRSDNALSTFLLTDHLNHVCTRADLKAGVSFVASYSFAAALQFPGGLAAAIPAAVGQVGDDGVANYMAGLSAAGRIPRAIGYVAPGWTSLAPNSYTLLSNGKHSALSVAALTIGKNAYLPTVANVSLGLSRPQPSQGGILTTPARAADGANPTLWVPLVPTVKSGYPIVGYSMIYLAQCYADTKVAASVRSFLKSHYSATPYAGIQTDNGLPPLSGAAKAFASAIAKNILSNANGWNTDIEDPIACAGALGR